MPSRKEIQSWDRHIRSTCDRAAKIQICDREMLEQHGDYILKLAEKDNCPVAIAMYLFNKRKINISVAAIRNFLLSIAVAAKLK